MSEETKAYRFGSTLLEDLGARLLVAIAVGYIRLVGATTKIRFCGRKNIPDGPFLYAFWHSRLLFLMYTHRNQGCNVLVSKSKDGELIAAVAEGLGFQPIRGSSSRSARESAIQLIRALRDKKEVCAITPDGPRGPAREMKDGVSFIARKTGCPVVPITCALKRKKRLHSWDRFVVPFPFNRAVVLVGAPIHVGPDDDPAEANERIGRAINRLTDAADRIAPTL